MRRWWPEVPCSLIVAALMAACGGGADSGATSLPAASVPPTSPSTTSSGSEVSLSERRGDVVVLTFLYTYCPDICPVVAGHLADLRDELSGEPGLMDRVSILVVSVDPERDTVDRAREYSDWYGMLDGWSYLVGGASG